jgi:hypothetical protein
MHVMSTIDQLSEVCPVLEVAGAAINLVDDDTICLTFSEIFERSSEDRPAALCSSFQFLEPGTDAKTLARRVPLDRCSLFLKGNALALLLCRYSDVRKI